MLSILEGSKPEWFDFEFVRDGDLKNIVFKLLLKPLTHGEIEQIKRDHISTDFDKKTHLQYQKMDLIGMLRTQEDKVAESILGWKGGFKEKYSLEYAKKLISKHGTTKVGKTMKTIKFFDEDGNETGQTVEKEVDQSLSGKIAEIIKNTNNFLSAGDEENLTTT